MKFDVDEVRDWLGQISPTFCIVKWKHISINFSAQTVKKCCHNTYRGLQAENIRFDKSFFDHPEDQKIRQELLNGERPEECSYCWKNEDVGGFSDRLYWSHFSFMREFYDEVAKHRASSGLTPSWLELNFSPTCQLLCSYCSPEISSSWHREYKKYGSYPTSPPHGEMNYIEEAGRSPYSGRDNTLFKEKFWIWFKSIYPSLRQLTLTGGEPLLSSETREVLEWIVENPNPQLKISINTNLSFEETFWTRYLDVFEKLSREGKIKALIIHPSIDTWGPAAEYIRHGLDLNLFKRNVLLFLQRAAGSELAFCCTLNNLSLINLREYWQYLLELKKLFPNIRISSTTEPLIYPHYQRISLLPKSYLSFIDETIDFLRLHPHEFSLHDISGLTRARALLERGESDDFLKINKKNFYHFFKEYDRRKNTTFLKVFPQMQEFWDECRKTAELVPSNQVSMVPSH